MAGEKIVIVTGATSGIGKAAAKQLVERNTRVILACRNESKALRVADEISTDSTRGNVEVMQVDMSDLDSVRSFAAEFLSKHSVLHVLINNAATFDITQKERVLNKAGVDIVWATNHLGPFLLIQLLLDTLKSTPDARIINVSSQGLLVYPFLKVHFDDTNLLKQGSYSVRYAYYHSKLAHLMCTYKLAQLLEGTDTTVNCVRVTNVAFSDARLDEIGIHGCTRAVYRLKRRFAVSAENMAKTYVELALSEKFRGVSGKHVAYKLKVVGSNRFSRNPKNWDKLWRLSLEQTGLSVEGN